MGIDQSNSYLKLIYAAIITFAAILIWDAITDFRKWKAGAVINHTREGLVRAALLTIPGVLFTLASGWQWWVAAPVSAAMMFFVWWLIFDGLLNTLMRQSPFHVGATSTLDRLQSSWPVWVRAAVKVSGTAITVYIYCYGY